MTERLINRYKRLFEIRLLHHYWLDEGLVIFDLIPDEKKRDKRLLTYDARTFCTIAPSVETETLIKNLGGVFKETALGCVVAVPDNTRTPTNTVFTFTVSVHDPNFFQYTAFTYRKQQMHEICSTVDNSVHRYKENVPLLSNRTGIARGSSLFLSREFPTLSSDILIESLILSSGALLQLTADQPGAGTQQIHPTAAELPVYVHQGDVPVITPPPGISGAPERGIEVTDDIPANVFTLLRLYPRNPGNDNFSFTTSDGQVKSSPPVFQVRFRNRSTYWRYKDKRTGEPLSTETEVLPLTYFGNAGSKGKPSDSLVKAEKAGSRIIKLISEIYA